MGRFGNAQTRSISYATLSSSHYKRKERCKGKVTTGAHECNDQEQTRHIRNP